MTLTLQLPDGRRIEFTRPVIMGILNVTPDSFSDGGRYEDVDRAVAHAQTMASEGADIIDIGGQSTRPGSLPVSDEEQIHRVAPVIEKIRQRLDGVVISIDTTSSRVARAAIDAGAAIINDVSAGRDDSEMFGLAAARHAPLVLMHMQGTPRTMQESPGYKDVVGEVESFLLDRARQAMVAGVAQSQIIIDPGIGFGKTLEHNLQLLRHLDRLVATGFPVLLGASRKRFIGEIISRFSGKKTSPQDLVGGTCATTALGVASGVKLFRVHDVQANRQAADAAWAVHSSP